MAVYHRAMRRLPTNVSILARVAPRAVLLWGLIRLVFVALPLAGGAIGVSLAPPPPFIVLFCGVVGLADIHRRGEGMLWANLGIARPALFAVYAVTAIPAEVALALAMPLVMPLMMTAG
jgi:hypothetical protein